MTFANSPLPQIQNIINELENQISKDTIDQYVAKTLMIFAVNRFNLLISYIDSLESKLESAVAENQRLQNIAVY